MRIAMFTNNYKPFIGGVPISIERLAEELRRQGHRVYVFAPTYENQEEEEYVVRYPSFPIRIAGAPIPNIFTGLIGRKVKELKVDVIHVHHPAIVGNVAMAIKRRYGIPVVFTYHTRYEEYLHYVEPLGFLERHTGFLEKYLHHYCGGCDLLAAPTPGIQQYLEEKVTRTPTAVLPTGLGQESFTADIAEVLRIRRQYKGDADYLFCTVSRLAEEKNLEFQLKGLSILKKKLKEKNRTFRHMIIGDGPDREMLQRKVGFYGLTENLKLLGNVENSHMVNYQNACDAFLFSSKSETQGIVILEALAAGNPVIAIRAQGVEDIVTEGKNGFLTSENPDEWVQKILYLMENEELHNQMKANAVKAAKNYSEEKVAETAVRLYNQVWTEARRNYVAGDQDQQITGEIC